MSRINPRGPKLLLPVYNVIAECHSEQLQGRSMGSDASYMPTVWIQRGSSGCYINCSAKVLACYYNNTLDISRAVSPSLESITSLFLSGNIKMWPPPRVWLNFDFYLLFLLTCDVSRTPGPSVHGNSQCSFHAG